MPKTAVTIVGSLTAAMKNHAAGLIHGMAQATVTTQVLSPGQAVDFIVPAGGPQLEKALRDGLAQLGAFDIFVQPHDAWRKKKLLVADMDSTTIEGEVIDELAVHAGVADQVVPITAAAMRGELDFAEALRQRVATLKGRPSALLTKVLEGIRPTRGMETVIRTMGRQGGHCVLISGGFDFFTAQVAGRLGFHKNFGNRLEIAAGTLTGNVLPPIVDKDAKKKTLESEAKALNIDPRATMAVGDGANDIPMLLAASVGVGYHAKLAVQAAVPHQIRYTDMTALLFMQGYRKEEFAAAP